MTVKRKRMDTCDNILFFTQSCDLIIFWSLDNKIVEYFKGTFPKNSNNFETNKKHIISDFFIFQNHIFVYFLGIIDIKT